MIPVLVFFDEVHSLHLLRCPPSIISPTPSHICRAIPFHISMKPGFLNDPKASKNGLGPLRDARSIPCRIWRLSPGPNDHQRDPRFVPSSDSIGSAPKQWKISKSSQGWGAVSNSSCTANRNYSPWNAPTTMKDNVNNDDTTTIATEPSAFTASTDMSKPNPYAGQPWLPNKTLGVPKAALNVWYMQKPRSFQCSKDQYICWSDGGRAHETKFTCVFVCPLSGELFFSGEYGDSKYYTTVIDEGGAKVVWYVKKAFAEHGAASRAYDCHSYRQYFGTELKSVHLGWETPYLSRAVCLEMNQPKPPPYPTGLNPDILDQIQQLVTAAQNRMDIETILIETTQQEQAEYKRADLEVELEREAYRQARGGSFQGMDFTKS